MHRLWSSAFAPLIAAGAFALAFTSASVGQLDAANASSARISSIETPPVAPDVEGSLKRLSFAGKFISVPVVGRIGTDVMPEGFEALAHQREHLRGASAIVIELDSDSGSDAAARRMAVALQEIGEVTPVIMVVRRAIGPGALLLPVASRVFISEPAAPGVLIALQPEIDPLQEMSIDESVAVFAESMAALAEQSQRREGIETVLADRSKWSMTAREAYAAGIAEPLEGGPPSLGRTLRIDPWTSSGRQVEDLTRRSSNYGQQLAAYRSRVIARAFVALEAANLAMAQMTAAEFAAASIDPRRHSVMSGAYRAQGSSHGVSITPGSHAAWQRARDSAVSAWQRVASLSDASQQALQAASADIKSLIATGVEIGTQDPVLAEAIDRLERERAEVASRIASTQARARAAREEAAAIAALSK